MKWKIYPTWVVSAATHPDDTELLRLKVG